MAIVAIAIKCESPGPVFERRQCVGIGGRRFDALSFRTTLHTVKNAELAWHRAPQMTRVGPYLLYTRIDDLPQLFNVLRGEVSIIDSVAYSPSFLDQRRPVVRFTSEGNQLRWGEDQSSMQARGT
jgi:lipopolysaccharide/colanic/teichoic acid biosynthesis glycosyltransferase